MKLIFRQKFLRSREEIQYEPLLSHMVVSRIILFMLAENETLAKHSYARCRELRGQTLGESEKTAWDNLPVGQQLKLCNECPIRPYDEMSCSFRWGRAQDIATLKLALFTVLNWAYSDRNTSKGYSFLPYVGGKPHSNITKQVLALCNLCKNSDPQNRPEEFQSVFQEIYQLGHFSVTNTDFSTIEGKVNCLVSYCFFQVTKERPMTPILAGNIIPGAEALLALIYEFLANDVQWTPIKPLVVLTALLWRQYLKQLKMCGKAQFNFYFSG